MNGAGSAGQAIRAVKHALPLPHSKQKNELRGITDPKAQPEVLTKKHSGKSL